MALQRKVILKTIAYAGFIGGAIFVIHAVFTSSSSTAAIGLLFVPVYGFLGAGLGWALAYSAFALYDLSCGNASWSSKHVLFAMVFLLLLTIAGWCYSIQQSALSVVKNANSTAQALAEINQRWIPWGRREVNIALAQHPSTPLSILAMLAESSDSALVHAVGANTSTPLAILEKIAAGSLTYVQGAGLAGNRNISRKIMEQLIAANTIGVNHADPTYGSLYKTYVLAKLAANTALPQDLFDRLAAIDSPTHFLVLAIINAPAASCEQIFRLLNSEASLENIGLYNTILNKLNEKKCLDSHKPSEGTSVNEFLFVLNQVVIDET